MLSAVKWIGFPVSVSACFACSAVKGSAVGEPKPRSFTADYTDFADGENQSFYRRELRKQRAEGTG